MSRCSFRAVWQPAGLGGERGRKRESLRALQAESVKTKKGSTGTVWVASPTVVKIAATSTDAATSAQFRLELWRLTEDATTQVR